MGSLNYRLGTHSLLLTFFGFDLTPDACDGSCFHLVQKGNLRIEMHFAPTDHQRRRVRRIRIGAGNRQEQERHLRFLMETSQIARLLARDVRTRSIVRDVVPKDGLPTMIDAFPFAFVCNTHDGDKPGQHWIALYVDADRRGEYFCSYGLPPLHGAFRVFLNEHCSEWSHNAKRLQSPLSNVCGQYCIAYLEICMGVARN